MLNDHSLVLGGVIATAALLGACAGGAIGDGNGEARAGTSFDGPDFGGPDFGAFDGGVEDAEVSGETAQGAEEPNSPGTTPPGDGDEPERPWADNTGYSGSLTSYAGPGTITEDGATYTDFSSSSTIVVDADNVTLSNFLITTDGRYGIQIVPGHSGIVIEDGEIRNASSAGILGVGFTGSRLYIHEMGGDGMKTQGSGGPTLVEYSFIEKIGTNVDSHADCNQISTYGSNITFRYNNCWIPTPTVSPYHSNAAFMNGSSSSISNYVIEHNWLNGGNYTIYGRPGISVRNNLFGGDYRYGIKSGSFSEWSGNRSEDTGEPL